MQKYYPHPNKLLLSDLFMPLWMNPGEYIQRYRYKKTENAETRPRSNFKSGFGFKTHSLSGIKKALSISDTHINALLCRIIIRQPE